MATSRPAAVQIWTAATGGGHGSAARALAGALAEAGGSRVTVEVEDATRLPIGRLADGLARAYGPLVRTSPRAWGLLFRAFNGRASTRAMDRFLLHELQGAMAARTRERDPRVVVSCHPLLTLAAARATAAQAAPARLVTLMTDLAGGHRAWLRPSPDLLLAATPEALRWCVASGLAPDQLRLTGLPVDPALGAPPRRSVLRQRLGLAPTLPCVLVAGGAEGTGHLARWVSWIARARLPLQVVVACGHNRRLAAGLRRSTLPALTVLGYQETLTPWLLAADVYLGRAGPSSLAEAAAAGLAIVTTGSLPGQEATNERLLVRAGAAAVVRSREQLRETLEPLCRPGAAHLARLQAAASAWARPGAAQAAAQAVLELL